MSLQLTPLPIRAQNLSKRFGALEAVSDVSLNVAPGEVLGLLGPNGAGKSTTLSMLLGLRRPDSGEALIFGHSAGSPKVRRLVGATPQAIDLPDQVSPREILTYTAARYGIVPRIDSLVSKFGLNALVDRRVAGFSGGEVRRVALALAFVGDPKLVFLDEPTTGLDTTSQDRFRDTARDYVAQGGALVLTSHHWDEIEAICDSIMLFDRGETVLKGRVADIRARASVSRLSFALPEGKLPPEWLQASHDGTRWHAEAADGDAVLRRMVGEGIAFNRLTLEPLKLKDLIGRLRTQDAPQ